jgi:hypothetical protein
LPAPPVMPVPPEPEPPSPFESAAEEFPQPAAAARTVKNKSAEIEAFRSVMLVGAANLSRRLIDDGSWNFRT